MKKEYTKQERIDLAQKLDQVVPVDEADEKIIKEAIAFISPEYAEAMDNFDDVGDKAWEEINKEDFKY